MSVTDDFHAQDGLSQVFARGESQHEHFGRVRGFQMKPGLICVLDSPERRESSPQAAGVTANWEAGGEGHGGAGLRSWWGFRREGEIRCSGLAGPSAGREIRLPGRVPGSEALLCAKLGPARLSSALFIVVAGQSRTHC